MVPCLLGIDFSGSPAMWGPRCSRSNVWVASLLAEGDSLRIESLFPVQELPGEEPHPFDRLAAFLARREFAVGGIDACFSLPAEAMPKPHREWLADVAVLETGKRPFPTGQALIERSAPHLPHRGAKLYRECDRRWLHEGLNPRSGTWWGPRGGAAMTAACATLLHRCGNPCWPWETDGPGLLCEAYPTAQLRVWGLPHNRYNGDDEEAWRRRETIVNALEPLFTDFEAWRPTLLADADPLDAVVAALACRGLLAGGLDRTEKAGELSRTLEGEVLIDERPLTSK